MTTRVTKDEDWSAPTNLGPTINTSSVETSPHISDDDLTFYFASWRPGGFGKSDIWYSTRTTITDSWSEPVNLGATFNSQDNDYDPITTTDGLNLFITSNRVGGYGGYDIWFTRRENISELWKGPLINLGPLINSDRNDIEPHIEENKSTIIFTSNRLNGLGNNDLWQIPIIPNPDLNRDDRVDSEDLDILIEKWGKGLSQTDIAPLPFGDGQVNREDLDVLLHYLAQGTNEKKM